MKHNNLQDSGLDVHMDAEGHPRRHTWIWMVLIIGLAAVCAVRIYRSGILTVYSKYGGQDRIDWAARSDGREDRPPVYEFVLSADETRMFCSHRTGIDIRNTRTGNTITVLDFHGKMQSSFSAASNGDVLLARYHDGSLVLWSVEPKSNRYKPKILARDRSLSSCAISCDSRFAATGHRNGTVTLWDMRNGSRLHRWQAHSGHVACVCFANDGLKVLSAHRKLCVWDAQTGKLLVRLTGHRTVVQSAVFSPDGRRVLSGGRTDGTLRLWDVTGATEIWHKKAANYTVGAVAWSPDGRLVASGNICGDVQVWDAKSGQRISTISESARIVSCVKFSSDGKKIYVSRYDGSIRVWEIATGAEIGRDPTVTDSEPECE